MLYYIAANMAVFWVVMIVLFLVIEALTAGLATIWFAAGALAALVAQLFGAQIWLQVVWFVVISVVTLISTRPLVKKYVTPKIQATNADMTNGMEALVTEAIDNVAGEGAVAVAGKVWTARSQSGAPIPLGTLVRGVRIEGVKLYVEPVDGEEKSE